MASIRQVGRDLSLFFCASVGIYLTTVVLSARMGLWLSGLLSVQSSLWLRMALGVVALDLSKLPGLIGAAWILGPVTRLSPLACGLSMVLFTFGLEVVVSILLAQTPWLWLQPVVLLARVAAAGVLVALAYLVVAHKRSR